MPTVTRYISRVDALNVKGGGTRYDICPARRRDDLVHLGSLQTWNAYHASLCERAKALNVPVLLGFHHDPKWGDKLDTVTLLERAPEAAV